ncbi:hypothetical protein EYF80_044881 [Liparis tanakae]|uniref:Uncharacterized protein n=1 Tax=Liparis tanakae TaxID=230148 RepID=A0A4Z2FUR5_9TELE|nr:hypothetical protein EYF80_044881 [Liparis tanakae]
MCADSSATVRSCRPMCIMASVLWRSCGLVREIRKRKSSLRHGRPYGMRVAPTGETRRRTESMSWMELPSDCSVTESLSSRTSGMDSTEADGAAPTRLSSD